jgi:hypothetical protein
MMMYFRQDGKFGHDAFEMAMENRDGFEEAQKHN